MPALGKSISEPLAVPPALSLPWHTGLEVQWGRICSGAGRGDGWKPRDWDPSARPHHIPPPCLLTCSSPSQGVFWGHGGLAGAAFGVLVLTVLCPREQWRAAAWASPNSVLLC